MISIKKFFEENPSIEKTQSKTLWALLRYISNDTSARYEDQADLINRISVSITPITQAALSRAIKKISNETLLIGEYLYCFDKRAGYYALSYAESGIEELVRLGDIYAKRKSHVMSESTLVFNLKPGKADLFVSTLLKNFDEDIFFGIGTQNDRLVYLHFDFTHELAEKAYERLKNFGSAIMDDNLRIQRPPQSFLSKEKKIDYI